MKFTRIFAVLTLLSLVVIPAMGELTDYQRGVADGLTNGLRMGRLLGAAPYDADSSMKYNDQVTTFNQGLAAVFGNNQTALNMFWMQPFGNGITTAAALGNYSSKPIHAIDASFNQTRKVNPDLLSQGKYYGYDLDSYIAMTGKVPSNIPVRIRMTGQDAYGSMGAAP